MSTRKALILSPKTEACQYLASILKEKEFEARFESDRCKAQAALEREGFDLILCDATLESSEKEAFISSAQKCGPKCVLLLLDLLAHSSKNSIHEACDRLVEHRSDILAYSPKMLALLSDAVKIARSHANVFISGESGTGKELMAKFIHDHSPRSQNPFIKVNCAALPETLVESEFFGHEKGSFTGAINRRMGRFELADLGTLLLDEISEVPLSIQSKLLRAVQEGEFERLGGMKAIKVNVRLISTSNRIMEEMIEKGLFREDLYYRLNVVPLHLPPLRERTEDIVPLAEYFLKRACVKNDRPLKMLSQGAKQRLLDYNWPGNIRELANLMEHVVVLDKNEHVEADDLPLKSKELPHRSGVPLGMSLESMERWYIERVLNSCQGNRTKAAQILGIHIRTLRNKLKESQ